MDARGVDPRDTSWEVDFPTYRVHFFTDPGGGKHGWASSEWELTDAADVHEVLKWAEENAAGRIYTVYLVLGRPVTGEKGLLTLAGFDPNWPEAPRRPSELPR